MRRSVTSVDTRRSFAGEVDRWCRGAALALSPGPVPGEEDGQGQDLVAGDLRLHEHQRDADPPRPLGLRQVRQAGVGYNIDSLLGEIRKILRTQGQHNIALVGAGRLGEAIASSAIFAEHGINIAAVFDTDPEKVGRRVGNVEVTPYERLPDVVHDKNIIVGVLAVPATSAQAAANDLIGASVKIIFNYSEALLDVPTDVAVHTSNPAVELLYALYFHLT